MTPKIVRYMIFSIAAGLMLAAMTACGGGGEEPTPEPEVDLQATIAARLANALPTDTPAPEPTDTPEPTAAPTPDLQATIAAAFEQTRAAMPPTPTPVPPTATPEPTPTPPPPPTNTPEPAPVPTNTPAPTNTPSPTAPAQSSGPPCIITGKVTKGGSTAPEGTIVLARIKDSDDAYSMQDQTDEDGKYILTISRFDAVFDLLVDSEDTDVDTPRTTRGCRVLLNLTVN